MWNGLFEKKSAAPSDVIARATGSSQSARGGTYAPNSKWDVDRSVTLAYERVMLVFRCIDAIACAQAGIPILVRRGDQHDGPIVNYPDIARLLNRRANTYEDAWQFRYRVSTIALLSPRGVFIEVVPSQSGGLATLHILPPGMTEPIPDAKTFVSGYRVQRVDYSFDLLPPERVIWIRLKPHPTDPYSQMTPLIAMGLQIETDFLVRMFNRTFLQNDGRPGMLVSIKGQLLPEDAAEIKRRFTGGYNQAGQTTVIESDGIDVQDMSANPRDVAWQELIKMSDQDIMVGFGVPESSLGNASGRTFDNADAEDETFYKKTVMDHCNGIARALDPLTGDVNDEDMVAYDWSKVDVLHRAEEKRRDGAANRVLQGLATINDFFDASGSPQINAPGFDVYFLTNGLIAGKTPEAVKAAAALPQIAAKPPMPGDPGQGPVVQGSVQGTDPNQMVLAGLRNALAAQNVRASRLAKQNRPLPIEAKSVEIVRAAHPYEDRALKYEAELFGQMEFWTNRQTDVVCERLMHTKSRKGTRHWDDGVETKALDPNYSVEADKWAKELKDSMANALRRSGKYEAGRVARDIEQTGVLKTILDAGDGNPQGKTALDRLAGGGDMSVSDQIESSLQPVYDMIEKAAQKQSQRIVDTIKQLDADGASMKQIQSEVRKRMARRSPWQKALSQTATTAAVEGVRSYVYGQAGQYVQKTWRSHDDERTRHTHTMTDGQVRTASKPFSVGGAKMMHPGDLAGPIEEVAGCRCWLDWSIRSEPRARARKSLDAETERTIA